VNEVVLYLELPGGLGLFNTHTRQRRNGRRAKLVECRSLLKCTIYNIFIHYTPYLDTPCCNYARKRLQRRGKISIERYRQQTVCFVVVVVVVVGVFNEGGQKCSNYLGGVFV
jgi:hypothetical protein